MTTEIIIISSIVFLAFLSIVIGIINWVLLSSTSSKISILEEEIEKKAKEFDSLKKERSTSGQNQQALIMEKPGDSESYSALNSFVSQVSPGIEVVRNVRAGFRQLETDFSEPPPQPATDTSEVLDIVDDGSRLLQGDRPENGVIEIMLFSATKKDTDFASAWKKLTSLLPSTPRPHVVINFKYVMFLYDKELHYLEKIQEVVLKQRGTITYMHCHDELRPIIASNRLLAHFIQERRI
jgi:hypothetical protein